MQTKILYKTFGNKLKKTAAAAAADVDDDDVASQCARVLFTASGPRHVY